MSAPSPEDTIVRAYALYNVKRFDDVAKVCRAVLKTAPRQFDALYLLGLVACHRGDATAGARLIKRAYSISPSIEDYDYMTALLR